MQNFKLQFWDFGGCVGYPLSSKSILKVVSQMVRLCDYASVLFFYLHIGFLTFLALLKNTFWDGTPCTYLTFKINIESFQKQLTVLGTELWMSSKSPKLSRLLNSAKSSKSSEILICDFKKDSISMFVRT